MKTVFAHTEEQKELFISQGYIATGGTDHNGVPSYYHPSAEKQLSEMELKVFNMTGIYSFIEIAEKLGISVKTVDAYYQKIKNKGF